MAGEAIPGVSPSMEDVARAHLDKRGGGGSTPFHAAQADAATDRAPRSAHVSSTPLMNVGIKANAALSLDTASKATTAPNPGVVRYGMPATKRKPEDF